MNTETWNLKSNFSVKNKNQCFLFILRSDEIKATMMIELNVFQNQPKVLRKLIFQALALHINCGIENAVEAR